MSINYGKTNKYREVEIMFNVYIDYEKLVNMVSHADYNTVKDLISELESRILLFYYNKNDDPVFDGSDDIHSIILDIRSRYIKQKEFLGDSIYSGDKVLNPSSQLRSFFDECNKLITELDKYKELESMIVSKNSYKFIYEAEELKNNLEKSILEFNKKKEEWTAQQKEIVDNLKDEKQKNLAKNYSDIFKNRAEGKEKILNQGLFFELINSSIISKINNLGIFSGVRKNQK